MLPDGGNAALVFANYFSIGHNDEEFLIQFGLMYEGQPAPSIAFTVVTTPGYARRLRELLDDSLRQFDHQQTTGELERGDVTDRQS